MSEEESDISTTSSESSSDSEDETIQDIPDKDFFKTLSCLKTKDPRIYDNNVTFFTEPPLVMKKSQIPTSSIKQKESVTESSIPNNAKNKFSLKDIDNDSSSEDEMSAFKKGGEEKLQEQEEDDYIQFLKGKKKNIEDKDTETTLKPLQDYWNTKELDENEKFLKDYILNKRYLGAGPEVKLGEENLSDDERELEEQAEYEENYNFRFENEDNLKLKRFPRTIEGSLRRKNDSRKKKRAEIAQRKKEEKSKKHQDIKKKQKEKLSEIEERLNKLKELTGNMELGFKDEEILEDFDPEKHDKKMNELFNDDYYNEGEEEHPAFNDDDESYWDDTINMDCDADPHEVNQNKLTRTQKKKLRKKKTYQDVLDLAKPAFDPKVHNNFKKYIDEYYSLDCEDFIDDIPCKFKYREVEPNDFGLSIEEILMADDNELNRWAPVKKITKRCPGHVEKNEVKIYKKKAQDEILKRKILPSLFIDPEELKEPNETSSKIKPFNDISQSKKQEESVSDEKLIDQSLVNTNSLESGAKIKKKKRKHDIEDDTSFNKNMDFESTKQEQDNQINEENQLPIQQEGITIQVNNTNSTNTISKKKKRRKKKKKGAVINSNGHETNPPLDNKKSMQNDQISEGFKKVKNNQQDNRKQNEGKFKNKIKKKFKKRKDGVINLSDSRLQAYGIKPKQFRSKILYSHKN